MLRCKLWNAVAVVVVALGVASSAGAVVGYVNLTFQPGDTLFANPLDGGGGNLLSVLQPTPPAPGVSISLWDSLSMSYTPVSVSDGANWWPDIALPPGTGARLNNPTASAFVLSFVGTVLNSDGTTWNGEDAFAPPSPLSGPAGTYLMGCVVPMSLAAPSHPVFTWVIGRDPLEGEQFRWLDPATQTMHTTAFTGGGWDNGDPTLDVAEAGFFALVPEPATAAVLVFGGLLALRRWRMK